MDTRERILRGSYQCVERDGLAALTVEAVAREAEVGRATVYRLFPGGHDQLVEETVNWEVGRFFGRLEREIGDPADLEERFVRAVLHAHRLLEEHHVLQQLLAQEADGLLPKLARVLPLVMALLRDEIRDQLEPAELRAGVDVEEAADHLSRLMLSYVGTGGRLDLDDVDQVRDLVRAQFLGPILAAPDAE